jgi:hypothetical protein
MLEFRLFSLGVAAFTVYNSSVILWELGKPESRVCRKCAVARITIGAGLAAAGLTLAFQPQKGSA